MTAVERRGGGLVSLVTSDSREHGQVGAEWTAWWGGLANDVEVTR